MFKNSKKSNRQTKARRSGGCSVLVEQLEPRQHFTLSDGDYAAFGRFNTTALDGTSTMGTPIRLTWSFVPDGTLIPPDSYDNPPGLTLPSTLGANMNAFGGGVQAWFDRMDASLNNWEAWTGLTFIPVFDDGAAWGQSGQAAGPGVTGRGDVRIAARYIDGPYNTLAYADMYDNKDIVIDSNEMSIIPQGQFWEVLTNPRPFRNTFAHEMGHVIGLSHVMPQSNSKLMEPNLSQAFEGPQFHDIRIAQSLYGDPWEKTGANLIGRNDTFATANAYGALPNGFFPLSTWANGFGRSIANANDTDYISFQIAGGRKDLVISATPNGDPYNRGVQGGAAPVTFFPQFAGDLNITLYNGAHEQIASASAAGLGAAEAISIRRLDPGTYYLRVGMAAGGQTQTYDLNTFVADYLPQAPSAPDLAASSDSGASNTDNITNDNTPTFTGTAEFPGQRVDLYDFIIPTAPVFLGSGFVDATGNWSVTPSAIPDGPHSIYAAVVDGTQNSTFSPPLAITIDTVAPAAPTGLRIRADFDSGISNSDNITNNNRPRFTFNLPEVAYETRISSGVQSIDLTTPGAQDVQFPNAFSDDSHVVTVYAKDLAGNTGFQLIPILIDTVGPSVLGTATFNYNTAPHSVIYNFSENVAPTLTSADFTVTRLPATAVPTALSYNTALNRATLTFPATPNGVLADGNYTSAVGAAGVTDVAGNVLTGPPVLNFRFLLGDANNDGSVNLTDFNILAGNFGLPNRVFSQGDFNYDGQVNLTDFNILAGRFGTSVAPEVFGTSRIGTPQERTRLIDRLRDDLLA